MAIPARTRSARVRWTKAWCESARLRRWASAWPGSAPVASSAPAMAAPSRNWPIKCARRASAARWVTWTHAPAATSRTAPPASSAALVGWSIVSLSMKIRGRGPPGPGPPAGPISTLAAVAEDRGRHANAQRLQLGRELRANADRAQGPEHPPVLDAGLLEDEDILQ